LSTVNEDEPTDEEVIEEIVALRTSIEQHALNYHDPNGTSHGLPMPSYVRREIGIKVIRDIIERNIDGSTVAQDLLDRLGGAALDPSDPGRRESLIQICRTAGRARRRTRNHPSSWTFGPWEDEVLFPSVTADSQIVLEERHD